MFARIFASSASSAPPFLRAKLPCCPYPRRRAAPARLPAPWQPPRRACPAHPPRQGRCPPYRTCAAHTGRRSFGHGPPAAAAVRVPPEGRARVRCHNTRREVVRLVVLLGFILRDRRSLPAGAAVCALSPQHPRSARSFRAAGHHAAPARFQRQQQARHPAHRQGQNKTCERG